jgi:dTDP-4-dehydrorhamnose reductase
MKVIITGASSYVGAKFYEDMKKKYDVIGTYNSNKLFPELKHLDITRKSKVIEFISHNKPDFIIHVAANASGGWCDKNPEQAIAINESGTKYIVEGANLVNAKMIFISSFAADNSEQLYGRTKLNSEAFVKTVKSGYIVLRPSLIMGYSPNTTNDRPFNRLLKNISEKTPAIYDTSWKFQPTWLSHLEEIVELVIDKNIINQTIPVSVPELKSRYDIAKDVLLHFGIEVNPEDKHDVQPSFKDNQSKLKELNLPVYTYSEMIKGLKKEIQLYLSK